VNLTGTTLGGRYEIGERLGAGGMAVVYRAMDLLLQRPVTVKVLRGEFASDESVVRRFRREAQAAASLSHPNIVGVYDVGREDDIHYIVMEYVRGRTLKEEINERGPLPAGEAVRIARQIAEALRHAHAHGIIHRDVKPHNVLLTAEGRVKVTDFGIAGAASGTTMTYAGALLGTVYYFSPEQAQGRYGDERSDLYALGVVLYEMLTGRVPFDGESPVSVALKHIRETVTPPREVNPRVPPAVQRLVMKAMAKEVDRRYQTAEEMIRDLEVLQGQLSGWSSGGRPEPRDRTQVVGRTAPAGPADDATRPGDRPGARAAVAGAGGLKGPPDDGGDGGDRAAGPSGRGFDEAPTRPVRKGWRPSRSTVWIAAFGVFFLMVGLGLFWVVQWFEVPEVTVPNVVGLELDQAYAKLEEYRLSARVVSYDYNSEVPAGEVISQDPASGATVKVNRTILLWVSKGPELVDVPDVVGLTRREAVISLEAAGLEVRESDFQYVFSDTVQKDRVVSQEPAGGTRRVPRGTAVRLVISKGPEAGTVVVPNFVGEHINVARVLLAGMGLTEGTVTTVESSQPEGTVIAQDPAPGAEVVSGTPVSFTVSGQAGGSEPGDETGTVHQTLIHFKVPDFPATQTVRIVITDAAGERTVYGEREHAAGYEGRILVNWTGDELLVRIYYNGDLSEEYTVRADDSGD
jgi:serine/threonine-protein kinase